MPYQYILYVEGVDDQHAIHRLLGKHDVNTCIFDPEEYETVSDVIAVKHLSGYEQLRQRLPTELLESDLRRAGVVADADDSPEQRWKSLRKRLIELGGQRLPNSLPSDGWIGIVQQKTGDLNVGAWLMPDNQQPGALEEFARKLVPGSDALWPYAESCVQQLPERRFGDKDEGKALVHTWLAWQERPRMAIGEAVSKGCFDYEAEPARNFVAWVRRLFDL